MRVDEYAATLLFVGITGCAGTVEVTQTYTPAAAAGVQSDKFVPVAVVRDTGRMPLPAGARVEEGRVVLPRMYAHKLGPGDVVQEDEIGRIVAVRSPGNPPVVTRFVPGTAQSPPASDEVRGELADDAAVLLLRPSDGVEMHGVLAPDDAIPGGGRVQSTRSTGALVAGVVLFTLSYGPSVYVGAQSPRAADRALEAPVVGPWMDMAQRPKCVAPASPVALPIDPCIMETASRIGLAVSGSVQDLGFLLTLVGLPSHSEIVEGGGRGVGARAKPHVVFVPTWGGAAAMGTF
jgi:hypothetical protein